MTSFSCCLPCSGEEQSSRCISAGLQSSTARLEELNYLLRCSLTLPHVQLHKARKRYIPRNCKRFQLPFFAVFFTEKMHWHGGPLSPVVVFLPHKKPRLANPLTALCLFSSFTIWYEICSSSFKPHFDGVCEICHRHWEQTSPTSIWMGSVIGRLLTGVKRQNMTCENIFLGKKCL